MARPLVGILVGGAASRMGGRPKGLLDAGGGEAIVSRLARIAGEANPSAVVLVGDVRAYDGLGLSRIGDASSGDGPLAGIVALLDAAQGQDVVALACDMPRIVPSILRRLIDAPAGKTLAPRRDGFWEPLCARYAANARAEAVRRLAAGAHALHAFLRAIDVEELELDAEDGASLVDWDTPEDVSGGHPVG